MVNGCHTLDALSSMIASGRFVIIEGESSGYQYVNEGGLGWYQLVHIV